MRFDVQDPLMPAKDGATLEGIRDGDAEQGFGYAGTDKRDSIAFFQVLGPEGLAKRQSCASLGKASLGRKASRASFTGNLTSRPSVASLKETISRINLELHPEKGSFVAYSMASIPTIAAKVYIITQILAAISVSMGSMAVGFTAGWTSPALASMERPNSTLHLTEDQQSWVGSLMPLSALLGSLVGGWLIEVLGRKMLICFCGPPFILAYLVMGSASHVWMLYVGRSVAGLCVGLLTLTLPVYLSETIQPEIRGTLGLLPTTLGNGGILVCFTLGAYVGWSALAYAGALIPAVFLVMMIFVPETPRWYISKGREEEAYKSLCWLRGTDADVDEELQDIVDNHEAAAQQTTSVFEVFDPKYRKPLGIALILMTFQQLSGINAVIFYSVAIFKSVGSSLDSNLCSIIIGLVNLMSTFLATALIDKLGRKILLHISNGLMIVSLALLTVYFFMKSYATVDPVASTLNATLENITEPLELIIPLTDEQIAWNATIDNISWLPLVCLMLYVTGFSLGWGPIPWLFMGEALPAKIRGTAASMVTALNWSFSFVITKLFPIMVLILGEGGIFLFFTVVMIVATVFTIVFVPETKGMSLEDIEASMMGRTKPSATANRQRKISEISGIMMH